MENVLKHSIHWEKRTATNGAGKVVMLQVHTLSHTPRTAIGAVTTDFK